MKPPTSLALLSLSALALAVAGAFLLHSRKSVSSLAPSGGPVHTTATAPAKPFARGGGATVGAAVEPAWEWGRVESEDYRKYVANLRDIECPEHTIRDIILADLNKLYAPKEAPFKDPPPTPTDPWTISAVARADDAAARRAAFERRKKLREVEKEKAAVVKELLGYTLPLSPLRGWHDRSYDRFEAALNSLPAEKRERVREMQEIYWEASDRLTDAFANKRSPEFVEQYKRNNDDRRAAMLAVLTPHELEDYEIRSSNTAQRLSAQFAGINVSEEEFKAIYRARAEIEEPLGGTLQLSRVDGYDPKQIAEKEAAATELLKQTLGDARYAQYMKAQDANWQALTKLQSRFDLSQETIETAYELQKGMNTPMNPEPEALKRLQDLQREFGNVARAGANTQPDQLQDLQQRIQKEQERINLAAQQAAQDRQRILDQVGGLLGSKAGLVFAARNGGSPMANQVITTTFQDGRVLRNVAPGIAPPTTQPVPRP